MATSGPCHRASAAHADGVGCVSICRSRYFWFWQAPLGIVELHLSRDDFREVERNFHLPPKGVQNAGAHTRSVVEEWVCHPTR